MPFSENLGDVTVRIRAKTDEFTRGLKRAENNVKTSTTRMSKSMGKLQTAVAGVQRVFVALAAAAALRGFASAVSSIEDMTVSFKSLTGSMANAKALMKDLQDFSASTPFQLGDIAKASRQLLVAGNQISELQGRLRVLGDVAAGANIPLTEMTQIFTKAQNKGRLYTEELLQLSDRGVPVIQELARQFNVTKAEVFELASQGKVSFADLEVALQSMTEQGGVFFGQMEERSKTLSGRWSTLKDNVIVLANAIGETLLPILNATIQAFTFIVQGVNQTIDAIKRWTAGTKEVTKEHAKMMKDLTGRDVKTGKSGKSPFAQAFEGVTEEVEETKSATEELKESLKEVKRVGTDSMESLKQTTQETTSSMQSNFQGVFGEILGGLGSAIGGGGSVKGVFGNILGSVAPKLINNFLGGLPGFANGGRPPIGMPSIVGERGPELFIPDSGGTVIPNEALGMGSGVTVNQTINVSPGLAPAIKDELRRFEPRFRDIAADSVAEGLRRGGQLGNRLRG